MEKDYKAVWASCLEIIKDNLGKENEQVFRTWFEPIVPVQLEDNSILKIQVPSPFFYEWLEQHFIDILRRSIRAVLGPQGMLKYIVVMDQSISGKPIVTTLPSTGGRSAVKNRPQDMPFNLNGENSSDLPNPFIFPGIKKVRVNSQLSDAYSLANFVEGDCNRLARSAGYAVAENPGKSYNPLLLHGGVGLGKTHLANAIGLKTKELHPEKTVL